MLVLVWIDVDVCVVQVTDKKFLFTPGLKLDDVQSGSVCMCISVWFQMGPHV